MLEIWLWFSAPLRNERFHSIYYEVSVRLSRFWKSPDSIGSGGDSRALPIHSSKCVSKFARLFNWHWGKRLSHPPSIRQTRTMRLYGILASNSKEIGCPVRIPARERGGTVVSKLKIRLRRETAEARLASSRPTFDRSPRSTTSCSRG